MDFARNIANASAAIAADFYWQFGSHSLSGSSTEPDTVTVFDDDSDFHLLVTAHAEAMATTGPTLLRRDKHGGFVKKRLSIV